MVSLSVGEAVAKLRRLGVDHQRFDGTCVVSVQDVRERAIAPEAAREMQLDEQARKCIEQLAAADIESTVVDQLPVGEGERDELGDDGRRPFFVRRNPATLDDPNRRCDRAQPLAESPQRVVLVVRQVTGELLDRIEAFLV